MNSYLKLTIIKIFMFGLSDFHTGDDKILMQKTLRIKLN